MNLPSPSSACPLNISRTRAEILPVTQYRRYEECLVIASTKMGSRSTQAWLPFFAWMTIPLIRLITSSIRVSSGCVIFDAIRYYTDSIHHITAARTHSPIWEKRNHKPHSRSGALGKSIPENRHCFWDDIWSHLLDQHCCTCTITIWLRSRKVYINLL